MSSHGDQLKSAIGITALVSFYGIASIAIYVLGSQFNLDVSYQIILIALLLLTLPLVILINYFRKKRAAARAASSGEAPAEVAAAKPAQRAKDKGAIPTRGDDELTRGAEESVQWLRSTRLGGAKTGDAVYALPWFLVAGPPASGKTSLLLSSGLDFHTLPSQRRTEQHFVRPTRNCEWRVTDLAVWLDTAGRYQRETPDNDEWTALIETIKKYRHDRPLDGFVIAASAAEIAHWSETEIEQQAKILRARLDEVVANARSARFPVYLVFTNLDVLEGFEDFFSTFHRTERAQVWGATIPLEKSLNAHALFDSEFDHLYEALMRRRLVRLGVPSPPAEQLRVFNLPARFADVRSRLGLFSSILFRPSPFSESPLLRGFYFTSSIAHQSSVSVDASSAPNAGAGNGDDGAAAVVAAEQSVGRDYFTRRFFKEVILNDKDLAASFQSQQKRPAPWPSILLIAASALLLLLTAGVVVSFINNRRMIQEATESGAQMDEITRADKDKDPFKKEASAARVEVEAVENLREKLSALDLYERESPPIYMRFGMYSGNSIAPSLRTIYFDAIDRRYYKPMVAALERDLQAFASASSSPSTTSSATTSSSSSTTTSSASAQTSDKDDYLGRNYDLLKAYLMLSFPEKVEPTFLADQLAEYWKKSSPPEMELVSQQQLNFFAQQASREDVPHIKINDKLVAAVRSKLAAYPAYKRFYKIKTTEVNAKVKPVTLDTILEGRGSGGVLMGSYQVPGSFTIEGYRNYMRAAIQSSGEEIGQDEWVMGSVASKEASQSTDVSNLEKMYLNEYAQKWGEFLKSIRVKPVTKKDDAVEVLKALSSPDSPVERVMQAVVLNTNLSAKPKSSGLWGWIKNLFSRGESVDTGGKTRVEEEFRPLFPFVATAGDTKDGAPMSKYTAAISSVLAQIEDKSDEQLKQVSKDLAADKDTIGLQKAEKQVTNSTESFKTASSANAATLLRQPLDNLRRFFGGDVVTQIEKQWREQIYPKSRALESSGFPFTDAGEASVQQIAEFLNPSNGQFTAFFKERLANYFDDIQGQWKPKDSSPVKFAGDFVKYLNSARQLREALFANDAAQQPEVAYDITLEPVKDSDVRIDLDNSKSVETRDTSAKSATFTWPSRSGSSGATITVTPGVGDRVEPKSFTGTWGLFKMFKDGSPAKRGDKQYALSWNIGSGANTAIVRATLTPAKPSNPFQLELFKAMRAPQNMQK